MELLIFFSLLLLLMAGARQDFRSYQIPNTLILPGALLGVLLNCILPNGIGLFDSLAGLGMGFLLLLPFYLLQMMAAGDVKFMAMTGAFLGPLAMVDVLLYTMVAGGILALVLAWHRKILPNVLQKPIEIPFSAVNKGSSYMSDGSSVKQRKLERLPYGIAITAGSIFFLFSNMESLAV